MRRSFIIVSGWLAATAATTFAAYVAVGAAGARVTDRPLSVVVADSTSTTGADNTGASSTTTSTSTSTTAASPTSTTSTTAATRPPSSTSTTTTTPSTTTTTSPPTTEVAWELQTIVSAAGTVVVSYRGDEVRLESVAPLVGYTYEVEDDGPGEVRVEFEGRSRVEVRAYINNGKLITEVNDKDGS